MEMYSNSLSQTGIDEVATKKPANNMKGTMSTGVSVTATYLLLKMAEMINE